MINLNVIHSNKYISFIIKFLPLFEFLSEISQFIAELNTVKPLYFDRFFRFFAGIKFPELQMNIDRFLEIILDHLERCFFSVLIYWFLSSKLFLRFTKISKTLPYLPPKG